MKAEWIILFCIALLFGLFLVEMKKKKKFLKEVATLKNIVVLAIMDYAYQDWEYLKEDRPSFFHPFRTVSWELHDIEKEMHGRFFKIIENVSAYRQLFEQVLRMKAMESSNKFDELIEAFHFFNVNVEGGCGYYKNLPEELVKLPDITSLPEAKSKLAKEFLEWERVVWHNKNLSMPDEFS